MVLDGFEVPARLLKIAVDLAAFRQTPHGVPRGRLALAGAGDVIGRRP